MQTRWDGVSLQNAVAAMLVKSALNKSLTVSPAKHPHTIKPPPPCFTVGTCGDHLFTFSASHKDTVVGIKNLTFGLIRPDFHRSYVLVFLGPIKSLLLIGVL